MTVVNPKEDRVVVKPDEKKGDTQTDAGIWVVESSQEEPQLGTVVSVGPGVHDPQCIVVDGKPFRGLLPVLLEIGDRVMYGKYSGTELMVDGEVVLVLRESDIILSVEE